MELICRPRLPLPEYKAGARARPKLSHPAPVKRGAGGLPCFLLDQVFHPYFFAISNFFHLWQVLGILQLDAPKTAHHVTQGDKIDKKIQLRLIFVLRRTISVMSFQKIPNMGKGWVEDRLKAFQMLIHWKAVRFNHRLGWFQLN